jgi:hypothetical protein
VTDRTWWSSISIWTARPRLDNGRRTTRVVFDLINVINGVAKLPQAHLAITRSRSSRAASTDNIAPRARINPRRIGPTG